MSFPIAAILDNFDRADAGPPPSASWTTPASTNGIVVSGNQCATGGGGWGAGIWSAASFAANQEVHCVIGTMPSSIFSPVLHLYARNNSSTDIQAAGTSYYFIEWTFWVGGAGGTHTLSFFRSVDGVDTQLGATVSFTAANWQGQNIGLRCEGTSIQAWQNGALVADRTDSVVSQAGYIGSQISDGTYRIDDFGGGTLDESRVFRQRCRLAPKIPAPAMVW